MSTSFVTIGVVLSLAVTGVPEECGGALAASEAPHVLLRTPAAAAAQTAQSVVPSSVPNQHPDSDAQYEKGAALAAQARHAEARAVFEAASHADPHDGSLAAAVAMYRDLAEGRVSNHAVQLMFRALQHANGDRWTAAYTESDEALALAPAYPRAHDTRAKLLLLQGRHEEAVAVYDRVLELDSRFAEGYFNRGAVNSALERYDAALADYNRAIELQPSFVEAYTNRGSAHANKKNLQAAIADYTRAHELSPRAVDPLYWRGVVHALSGRWDESAADFTRVVERDGGHALAHYNLGLAYQNQGDDERALAGYTRAIDLDAANYQPLINRGLIRVRRKQYDLAIADYDKALSLEPNFVIAHYNKAQAYEQAGRVAEASAEYRVFLQQAGPAERALALQARQRLAALEKTGR